jgi:hypothetical protein
VRRLRLLDLVDEGVKLGRERVQRRRLLRRAEFSLGDGLVELRLRVVEERLLQPVDRLALVAGDLRERLACLQLVV